MDELNEHRPMEPRTNPPLLIDEQEMAELDNPNDGNPDAAAGDDCPEQRPITDNKAGG